jgi:DNA-binding transcriptional LysR family regulator
MQAKMQSDAYAYVRACCKDRLVPRLGQFARDYPNVELDITTDDSRVDPRALRESQ